MRSPSDENIETLIQALNKPSAFARMAALSALKSVGEAAVPHLEDPLTSEHETLRQDVAKLLSEITIEDPTRQQQAVQMLTAALDDPHEPVGWYAAKALGRLGPAAEPAVPRLKLMLNENYKPHPSLPETNAAVAARALERIGTHEAGQAADDFLMDQDWGLE